MLSEKIFDTGLVITYEDHEDLWDNQKDILAAKELFSDHLKTIKNQIRNMNIKGNDFVFSRIDEYRKMMLYVCENGNNNPYLFIYDSRKQSITQKISADDFKLFMSSHLFEVFKKRCADIGTHKYSNYLSPAIMDMIAEKITENEKIVRRKYVNKKILEKIHSKNHYKKPAAILKTDIRGQKKSIKRTIK